MSSLHTGPVRSTARRIAILGVLAGLVLSACSGPGHPSGWKAIDYHGVRAYVPGTWPVEFRGGTGIGCATLAPPTKSVVLVVTASPPPPPGVHYACAVSTRGSVPGNTTIVVLVRSSERPTGVRGWHVATENGLRGYESGPPKRPGVARGYRAFFYAERSKVALIVNGRDLDLVRSILGNLRPAPGSRG